MHQNLRLHLQTSSTSLAMPKGIIAFVTFSEAAMPGEIFGYLAGFLKLVFLKVSFTPRPPSSFFKEN